MNYKDIKKMPTFNKDLLEHCKHKYNVTMDQIIKEIKPKNEFANWKVKISRLINKKETDPTNFGLLELSENLADYFNLISNDEIKYTASQFLEKPCIIDVVGECVETGEIIEWKKNKWKIKVPKNMCNLQAYYIRQGVSQGKVRIAKKLNVAGTAEYNFSIVKQKKTNKLFYGYLKPLSNGKFNICDFSVVSGQTEVIHPNIEITHKTKIIDTISTKDSDWIN
tara:strand:- start:980 stop:1648 length:669 start_codon:yes stop_codon:yes gene_type:complete